MSRLHRILNRLVAKPAPLRAALLNTGELILVDGQGSTQVLSAQTTDLIRDVLAAAETTTPLMVGDCTRTGVQEGDEGPLPGGPGRTLYELARRRDGAQS
jgi:hypothetical protein